MKTTTASARQAGLRAATLLTTAGLRLCILAIMSAPARGHTIRISRRHTLCQSRDLWRSSLLELLLLVVVIVIVVVVGIIAVRTGFRIARPLRSTVATSLGIVISRGDLVRRAAVQVGGGDAKRYLGQERPGWDCPACLFGAQALA